MTPSPHPSLADAQAEAFSHVRVLASETVEVSRAGGRVLARDVESATDLPPFDNSAMDGFAVVAADLEGATSERPVRLPLTGESRAGTPAGGALEPGRVMRISTGAAVPEGADAVVRVEDTRLDGDEVEFAVTVSAGNDIRPAGDDVERGQVVLSAGARLRAGDIAMLAAVGVTHVEVAAQPRVKIVATGDELVAPGGTLGPGQIFDSNSQMLTELVRECGVEPAAVLTRVADDPAAVDAAIAHAVSDTDVVIICGGVSMGEHDHVKQALDNAGVEQRFWQVALRPGHPVWFGVRPREDGGETLVFGLPGNPVSVYATFHKFVAPTLRALQGDRHDPLTVHARYRGDTLKKKTGFTQIFRCRLTSTADGPVAELTSRNQRSHALASVVEADGLLILAEDVAAVSEGDTVPVELLRA